MVHYGQLVPRGLYGWGGYGGSVFLWDPAREVGFAYIPTYLAWWDTRNQHESLHYGLTGGWVQKFKASYLAYFLQCALTDYVSGKA